MSATRPSPTTPGAFLCPRCGGALGHGQDWCLECGLAARTRIHPPPGWRGPILATLLVAALLAAGIAFGLAALLDEDHPQPAAATVTAPATTPAAATPTTATPGTTTPGATTPATTPTTTVTPATVVPGTGNPSAASPTPGATTAPSSTTPRTTGRSFTIPGTHIKLPGTATTP